MVVGNEKAKKEGKGSWQLEGEMIDKPVVSRAEGLLELARACGGEMAELVDQKAKEEKGKGQ